MKDKYLKIVNKGDCIPEELLMRYINKQATKEEQHYVEHHTMECEMCSDMLEGLLLMDIQNIDVNKSIDELENKIDSKLAPSKKMQPQWQWLAAAASIALLIGIGFYFYPTKQDKQIAETLIKKEVPPAVKIDSLHKENDVTGASKIEETTSDKKIQAKIEDKPKTETPKPVSEIVVADGESNLETESKNDEVQNIALKDETALQDGGFYVRDFSAEDADGFYDYSDMNKGLKEANSSNISYNALGSTASDSFLNAISVDSLQLADQSINFMYERKMEENLFYYDAIDQKLHESIISNAITPKEELQISLSQKKSNSTKSPSQQTSSDTYLNTKSKSSTRFDAEDNALYSMPSSATNTLADQTYSWPPNLAITYANAYILMEPTNTIKLETINQPIKTKSVSLDGNKIANLMQTINTGSFIPNYSQIALSWKSIIVFYNNTSQPIAYIALSEDEKTVIRYPSVAYSTSTELIQFIKSLLQ